MLLLMPLAAHAQYGDWEPNWTQIDDNGNSLAPYVDGWRFVGTLTGTANLTGNYPDMRSWWSEDTYNRPLAFSPTPNPPGTTQSFLFGGPDVLDNLGLTIGASASNYFAANGGRGSAFGDSGPGEDVTGGVSVHERIPLKLRLKWTPTPDGDYWYDGSDWYDDEGNPIDPPPAPDHINLLVTTSLGAGTSVGNAPFIGGSFTGQVGRAASATVSESKFGGSVTASISDADPSNASGRPAGIAKFHLLKVPVSGGIAEVETDVTGDAQASAPTPVGNGITYSTASAYGDVSARAVQDDRAVTIDPMGHEVTYHKGTLTDPVTGMTYPGPEANKPSDTTLQVDIGLPLHNKSGGNGDYSVSYKPIVDYGGYPDDETNKGDTFDLEEKLKNQSESGTLPLFVGGDDPSATTYDIPPLKVVYQMPDVYFDLKPYPENDYDYDYGHPHLDKGDAGSGDGVKLNYTFVADGAEADYTLNVILHLPDENWHLDDTAENDTPPFEDVACEPESQMAQFSVTVNYSSIQNYMALGGQTLSAGLTAIAALCAEDPRAAACIAVLGYVADKAAPEPATATMGDSFGNWSDAVNNGLVIGADLSNYNSMTVDQQKALWAQCTWTLKKRVPIKTYHWEAEHYEGLGYTGQVPTIVTQALDPVYYHCYTFSGTPPPPPPSQNP